MIKSQLIKQLKELGHPIESFMLVGVRSKKDAPDQFDDVIYLLTSDFMYSFPATTNPGGHWLQNLLNPKGAAILKPGSYKYKIGTHKTYKALVQASPVTVYRDSDKDLKSEKTDVVETGYFGINIHRASAYKVVKWIGKYSAGCQVIQDPKDFDLLMEQCEKSGKKTFLYSLIEEQ